MHTIHTIIDGVPFVVTFTTEEDNEGDPFAVIVSVSFITDGKRHDITRFLSMEFLCQVSKHITKGS